jgi:mannose-6-phosphate isomerase
VLRELTGLPLPPDEPAAEWWIGAHPLAPSVAVSEVGECPLDLLIARAPAVFLGPAVARRFGRLPFLLKVLDVAQMLSIQAHPSKEDAEAGFAREQRAGVPLDSPVRTYKDDNHKPEAQVALTPFWLLYGFRAPERLAATLAERPELAALQARLTPAGDSAAALRSLFAHIMTLSQDAIDTLLGPLVSRLAPLYHAGRLPRESPDFWAARAAEQFPLPGGHLDRGILSIYLMNLVSLAPGEGTFLGAGLLHAYLEGTAVEVMANSDNVIRGGLTPKHVDVPELLRVLAFEPAEPARLSSHEAATDVRRYQAPVPEFTLAHAELPAGGRLDLPAPLGPQILIVLGGATNLRWPGGALALTRGSAVFVPPGLTTVLAARAPGSIFMASVPADS